MPVDMFDVGQRVADPTNRSTSPIAAGDGEWPIFAAAGADTKLGTPLAATAKSITIQDIPA